MEVQCACSDTCCVVLAPVGVGLLLLLQHRGTGLNGLASQAFGEQSWGTAARLPGLITPVCQLQVRGMGATCESRLLPGCVLREFQA